MSLLLLLLPLQLPLLAAGAPEQGHLALTDAGVSLTWVDKNASGAATAPAVSALYGVRYGLSPDNLDKASGASVTTYARTELCGAPANTTANWVDPGHIFYAEMDLTEYAHGTRVFYSFGADAANATRSATLSFTHGTHSPEKTSFIAYGDMGLRGSYHNSTEEILAHLDDVDFVLHIGDIAYAEGQAWRWDDWFREIAPVATRVPYHVCLGNHEFDYPGQSYKPKLFTYATDSGGECGIPYDRRFNMPGPVFQTKGDSLSGSRNIYHSRDVGMVHFVMISSEHDMTAGSEQLLWLEKDLAGVNRTATPWVVFAQHRPLYGNTVARFLPENAIMRKALEPLLIRHKVDLALMGHIHQYQRTCRMVKHKCDDSGPVYMVVGTAGATHQVPFLPKASWVRKQTDLFGISKMVAENRTHMSVKYFLDQDGAVGDEFFVVRSDAP
jgi:acid phosphatase type 7